MQVLQEALCSDAYFPERDLRSMAGLFLLYRKPAMSRVALISKWMHLTIGVPTSLYGVINSPAAAPLIARMYTLVRQTTTLNCLLQMPCTVDVAALHVRSLSCQLPNCRL